MATRFDVAEQHHSSDNSAASKADDNTWTNRLGMIQTSNDNVDIYAMYGQSASQQQVLVVMDHLILK
jgi:hypothetical protein